MLPGTALDCRGGGRVPRTRLRRAVPRQAKQLRPPVEDFLASRPATNITTAVMSDGCPLSGPKWTRRKLPDDVGF